MQNRYWSKLDNVAIIFPSARYQSDTHVFRFSCNLYEAVEEEALTRATEEMLDRFPFYRSVLKRGLFWYYLDESDVRPVVHEENKPPCAAIYFAGEYQLLFEVTYYKNRINLEVFHVLTDGTGAIQFFTELITRYMTIAHGLEGVRGALDASTEQMQSDAFIKHYNEEIHSRRKKSATSHRLKGVRFPDNRLSLISARMNVRDVLDEAHKHGVSMTTFLCAAMMNSIREQMSLRELKKPITACVPVNLRNHFESKTMRNFFITTYVPYSYEPGDDFSTVVKKVDAAIKKNLSPSLLEEGMNALLALENRLISKIVPLFIKNIALNLAYRADQKRRTFTISNVGVIRMPEEIEGYIESFDVFSSTNQAVMTVVSFRDVLSINITSPFVNRDYLRAFIRSLTKAGVAIELSTNIMDGGELS